MKNRLISGSRPVNVIVCLAVPALLLASNSQAQQIGGYTVIDDDPSAPSGAEYITTGISGSTVLGYYSAGVFSPQVNFLYNNGTYTDLNVAPPGSTYTMVDGISGDNLYGTYNGASTGLPYVYNFSSGTYTFLPPLPAGYNYFGGYAGDGFVGVSGNSILFQGNSTADNSAAAILYNNGSYTITPFSTPSGLMGAYLDGVDGNNIIGDAYDSSISDDVGFILNNGIFTLLADPNTAQGSKAQAISGNLVAGEYGFTGFIYNTQTGTYSDVTGPNGKGIEMTAISGTNFTGYYVNSAGQDVGLISSISEPTPEPATWALLGMGAAGLLRHRRRK